MDASKLPTFSNTNQNHHMQQQQQQQQPQQSPHHQLHSPHMNNAPNNYPQSMTMQQNQQQQQLQIMIQPHDSMPKLAGIDRLQRRMNNYRQRHTYCGPRFDQSFSGACEQQTIETTVLQKRFLENKAKKSVKKTEKRQPDQTIGNSLQNNVHIVSVQTRIFINLL